MADKDPVFDKLAELLKTNRGVFIGEDHYAPLAADFTISHFEQLRNQGVTTIYVEIDEYVIDTLRRGGACSSYRAQGAVPIERVAMNALAAGLRVIGHDALLHTGDAQRKWLASAEGKSNENMNYRDRFAVQLIEKTQDGGKFIVYGGYRHSGNEQGPDRTSIDTLLKIPSMDFHVVGPTYSPDSYEAYWAATYQWLHGKPTPTVARNMSGASTYTVTANDPDIFQPYVPPEETDAGRANIARAAKAPGLSDEACTFDANLRSEVMLAEDNIDTLARFIQKPAAKATRPGR